MQSPKLMEPECNLDAHGPGLLSGWEELVREGKEGSLPLPKWAPPLSRSKEGRRGSRKVCFSPCSPTPFGAHGGNFSRATITLVADNSNVLINAHRHASSSFSCSTPFRRDCGRVNICVTCKGWMRSKRYKVTLQYFLSDYYKTERNLHAK